MRLAGMSTFISALLVTVSSAESLPGSSCRATPKLELVSVIAPAAGSYPVWVVDGSYGHWRGAEVRVKTAWILARDKPGDLMVVARKLDGEGQALFASRLSANLSARLFIADADRTQMIPGGIEPGILRQYSFRSSGVTYPSAGCWEFQIRYGNTESRIVLELTDRPFNSSWKQQDDKVLADPEPKEH